MRVLLGLAAGLTTAALVSALAAAPPAAAQARPGIGPQVVRVNPDLPESFEVELIMPDVQLNPLPLRSGPGLSFLPVGFLTPRTPIATHEQVVDESGTLWKSVEVLSGPQASRTGWVAARFVTCCMRFFD